MSSVIGWFLGVRSFHDLCTPEGMLCTASLILSTARVQTHVYNMYRYIEQCNKTQKKSNVKAFGVSPCGSR